MTKPRVLVADPLPDGSLDKLREIADVEVSYKLPKEALQQRIGDFVGLVVRSETKVTKDVIDFGSRLQVIARAGVGVDNIDVDAATQKGIVVLNSPEGNTLAAAEHTMAMMLSMARKIPLANASTKKGEWTRGKFVGAELYGKTLGIVGLGRIGREVAARAKSFRMNVLGYDPFVNEGYAAEIGVKLLPLEKLLAESNFVTLHMPLNADTQGMMGKERIALMPKGSFLINCARGGLIQEDALAEALQSGHLAGAALDVFSEEPPKNAKLLELDSLVVTPHLGASTVEAQQRVAFDVVEQLLEVLQGRPARSPVNIPALSAEKLRFFQPYLTLLEKMGSLLSQLTKSPVTEVQLSCEGEIVKEPSTLLTSAALKGLLEHELGESVNFVNALVMAKNRGVKISESRAHFSGNYNNYLSMKVITEKKFHTVSGAIFDNKDGRVLEVDGFALNFSPVGCKIFTWHTDKPGMVGLVGSCLGKHGVNIAEMQVGRDKVRGNAVMVLSVDDFVSHGIVDELRRLDGLEDARVVFL